MPSDFTGRRRRRRHLLAALGALLVAGPGCARAAAAAPVTFVVPAPGRTSSDQLGRGLADALARILEIPVRVENVVGDGGVAGTNAIAAGSRDGTLLGLGTSDAMIGGRILSRNAKFNPIDDFEWLAIIGTYPAAMVVADASPQRDIGAWLASARETPAPLVYASVGTGSTGHLAGGFLRMAQGAHLIHRSVEEPEERYALLGEGKISALFDGLPNARLAARRSSNRIIAVSSAARIAFLPDVPCFGELWQQSFVTWFGLIAPKGLDNSAYFRLASAVGVLLGEARFQQSLPEAGVSFLGLSGRATQPYLDSEILRGAKLIAELSEEGMRK